MITCTFAGHREVFGACTQKIENALETLMKMKMRYAVTSAVWESSTEFPLLLSAI